MNSLSAIEPMKNYNNPMYMLLEILNIGSFLSYIITPR